MGGGVSRERWCLHGVYEILNLENGKRYIGSSAKGVEARLAGHIKRLRANRHGNRHLQSAWNLYGESAFALRAIFHCSAQDCVEFEQHFMDQQPRDTLYNLAPKAGSILGLKWSDESKGNLEHKAKRAAAIKTSWTDPERKAKMSSAMKAIWKDPEYRARFSDARKATWKDPECKVKISAAIKFAWKDPECRAKVSTAMKTLCADPTYKAKKIATAKVMWAANPERKAKMSVDKKAMWSDPEFKAKMSANAKIAMKAKWADPEFRAHQAVLREKRKASKEI